MNWFSPKRWRQSIFPRPKERESRTDVFGNVISKGHLFILTEELGAIELPAKRIRGEKDVTYQALMAKLPDDVLVTSLRLPADGVDHHEVRFNFEKPRLFYREEEIGWVIQLSLDPSSGLEPQHEIRRLAPSYDSGLFVATKEGDSERVRSLLKKGADASQKDSHHFTPLHSAALRGELEIVSLLLDAGANVHAGSSGGMGDELGTTPFQRRGGAALHAYLQMPNAITQNMDFSRKTATRTT